MNPDTERSAQYARPPPEPQPVRANPPTSGRLSIGEMVVFLIAGLVIAGGFALFIGVLGSGS